MVTGVISDIRGIAHWHVCHLVSLILPRRAAANIWHPRRALDQ
jgi:hypothetical protein